MFARPSCPREQVHREGPEEGLRSTLVVGVRGTCVPGTLEAELSQVTWLQGVSTLMAH